MSTALTMDDPTGDARRLERALEFGRGGSRAARLRLRARIDRRRSRRGSVRCEPPERRERGENQSGERKPGELHA